MNRATSTNHYRFSFRGVLGNRPNRNSVARVHFSALFLRPGASFSSILDRRRNCFDDAGNSLRVPSSTFPRDSQVRRFASSLSDTSRPPSFHFTETSTPVIESLSEVETKLLRESATKILSAPVGSFHTELWFDAEDAFKWWLSQDGTVESISLSFRLLDRLLEERRVSSDESLLNARPLAFLDYDAMLALVRVWYEVWKEEVSSFEYGSADVAAHQNTVKSPLEVLKLLEGYENEFANEIPCLSLSSKQLSYIMSGLSFEWQHLSQIGDSSASIESLVLLLDDLLHRFLDRHATGEPSEMSLYLINTVLNVWSKSGRIDAVNRAEAVFAKVTGSAWGGNLDLITYNTLLDVYAQAGKAQQAQGLLEAMAQQHQDDDIISTSNVVPDAISFSTTAAAWARSTDPKAPERATDLLRRMMDPFDTLGRFQVVPGTSMFNAVLNSWARSGRGAAASEEAHRLLNDMREAGLADNYSYATALQACAKAGRPSLAETILKEFLEYYASHPNEENLRPSVILFTTVMDAWTRSNSPEKVERARAILDNIDRLHSEGVLLEGAETWAHNVFLACIGASHSREKAQLADAFLQEMKDRWIYGVAPCQPDSRSYTTVMLLYVEGDQGHNRVDELMEELFTESNSDIDVRTVARVITFLSGADMAARGAHWLNVLLDFVEQGSSRLEGRPTVSVLGAVLAACNRISHLDPAAATIAEQLVQRFHRLHENGVVPQGPDQMAMRSLLSCLSQSCANDAEERAFELLQHMRRRADDGENEMMPDILSFDQVMKVCAQRCQPEKSELVFRQMLSDHRIDASRARPDVECFNRVLLGWANAEEAATSLFRAESFFNEMKENGSFSPNRKSFNALFSSMGKTKGDVEVAERIQSYFEEMKRAPAKRNIKPSAMTYKHVIEAWTECGRPDKAESLLFELCHMFKAEKSMLAMPRKAHFGMVVDAWKKIPDKMESSMRIRRLKELQNAFRL